MGNKSSIEKEIKSYFKSNKNYSRLVVINDLNTPYLKLDSRYGSFDFSKHKYNIIGNYYHVVHVEKNNNLYYREKIGVKDPYELLNNDLLSYHDLRQGVGQNHKLYIFIKIQIILDNPYFVDIVIDNLSKF